MDDLARNWRSRADRVTLSGCQSALGRESLEDWTVGLPDVFFEARARGVL
mgnify:CR=1 FL=1